MGSLPAERQNQAGKGRASKPLSRRRVRQRIGIYQHWEDQATGLLWQVAQIHRRDRRGDGTVRLVRLDQRARYVSFAELGADYRLLAGEREG